MILRLKTKKILKPLLVLNVSLILFVLMAVAQFDLSFNSIDFKLIDYFYSDAVESGYGPEVSNRIVLLNVTDDTYEHINRNTLDRKFLAEVNKMLGNLGPEAVMYDIIFAHGSDSLSDNIFSESISIADNIYLPGGFHLQKDSVDFIWDDKEFYKVLQENHLGDIRNSGVGTPFKAKYSLPQYDEFIINAKGSGHISATPDEDGVFRFIPMLIQIDSLYHPAVTLSMFLDYNNIPLDSIEVVWGEYIKIPALENSFLDDDLSLPIDNDGKLFIPFANYWSESPMMMDAHDFIKLYNDDSSRDELYDIFEGAFVFIGDISTGISDIGNTTLEENVPLITIHTAVFNSFLGNQFYTLWGINNTLLAIGFSTLVLLIFFLFKRNFVFYAGTGVVFVTLFGIAEYTIQNFTIIPVFTITGTVFIIFLSLLISMQIFSNREEAFIKNAFSKYVPTKVVNQLIQKPGLLTLGGEERYLTILFSDLADFTKVSENIPPAELVAFLNDYLSEMTEIIMEEGGIVDKYLGDGIIAEFGAPIPTEDHAGRAVNAALKMQERIREKNSEWAKSGMSEIKCRFGINTGNIILGNIGSKQVFDYTAIGDDVNLAARLEGANKFYDTFILVSAETFMNLDTEKYHFRPVDVIQVKGKSKAIGTYEIIDFKFSKLDNSTESFLDNYKAAYNSLIANNVEEAEIYLDKCKSLRENDKSVLTLKERIAEFKLGDSPEFSMVQKLNNK